MASLSAGSVWWGGCGRWAGGTVLPKSCLRLLENKVQLKLLMSPFRLALGTHMCPCLGAMPG